MISSGTRQPSNRGFARGKSGDSSPRPARSVQRQTRPLAELVRPRKRNSLVKYDVISLAVKISQTRRLEAAAWHSIGL